MRVRIGVILSGWLLLLAACGASTPEVIVVTATPEPTLVPSSTFTPQPIPSATFTPITPFTPTPDVVAEAPTLRALLESEVVAPLRVSVPAGWVSNSFILPVQDLGADTNLPFSYYSGPVTGGVGTIVVLWGFPNIFPRSLAEASTEIESLLWADGLRLLYFAVLDIECNIGRDDERMFSVGGQPAVGSYFAAVACPGVQDVRGWFAVLRHEGVNFAFYTYVEPMDALNGPALGELQAILDTVQLDLTLLDD